VKRGSLLLAATSLTALGVLLWLWSRPPRAARLASLEDEVPNFGDSLVLGARPAPPLAELPASDRGPGLSFFALGDTGYAGALLKSNVEAMEHAAEAHPVDFVILLGDNFYPSGVKSSEDPLWRERFEEAFTGPNLQVPFYAVLGNHDHRGDPEAQVVYTRKSARWRMPARWFTFTVEVRNGGEAQFFALDTQPFRSGWQETRQEESWLVAELLRSKARWKIVFGHHPVLSHGSHGPTEGLDAFLAPLLERAGVDLYISGHDHDLQLLRSKAGWLQLVSGAGSSTRDTAWASDTLFAAASPGFAWIGIGAKAMWIEIATASSGPLFRWKVEKP
jgi:acid phosphatase